MKRAFQHNNKTVTLATGIALGVAISMMITVLGAAALAWIMEKEMMSEQGNGIASGIILILSSALGGLTARLAARENKLIVCALHVAVYLLALLCVNALFFGGEFHGVVLNSALILVGGCAVLFGVPSEKNNGKRRRKIKAYR